MAERPTSPAPTLQRVEPDYVAKKYPYMVNDSGSGTGTARPADADLPDRASGRQTNVRKQPEGLNRSALEVKFPALRRRR